MQCNQFAKGRRSPVRGVVRTSLCFVLSLCASLYFAVSTWQKPKLAEGFAPLSPAEIALVKSKTGIYTEAARTGDFENVIMLTAGNFGYVDVYRNWACHARRLGLKWLLIASDEQMYNFVGPDDAILSQNAAVATMKATKFRDARFNLITCSKLQDVHRISISANVDVVFSDCDNVFRHDPFALDALLWAAPFVRACMSMCTSTMTISPRGCSNLSKEIRGSITFLDVESETDSEISILKLYNRARRGRRWTIKPISGTPFVKCAMERRTRDGSLKASRVVTTALRSNLRASTPVPKYLTLAFSRTVL